MGGSNNDKKKGGGEKQMTLLIDNVSMCTSVFYSSIN